MKKVTKKKKKKKKITERKRKSYCAPAKGVTGNGASKSPSFALKTNENE